MNRKERKGRKDRDENQKNATREMFQPQREGEGEEGSKKGSVNSNIVFPLF